MELQVLSSNPSEGPAQPVPHNERKRKASVDISPSPCRVRLVQPSPSGDAGIDADPASPSAASPSLVPRQRDPSAWRNTPAGKRHIVSYQKFDQFVNNFKSVGEAEAGPRRGHHRDFDE